MTHPDPLACNIVKASPGYRPGEAAAIREWREAHKHDASKVIICPGFPSGGGIPAASPDSLSRMDPASERYIAKLKGRSQAMAKRVLQLHALDGGPGCFERIAAKLGISQETVRRKIREAREDDVSA